MKLFGVNSIIKPCKLGSKRKISYYLERKVRGSTLKDTDKWKLKNDKRNNGEGKRDNYKITKHRQKGWAN